MIKDKNSKNKATNVMLQGLFVVTSLFVFAPPAWASEGSVGQVLTPIIIGWLVTLGVSFKKPKIGLILAALCGLGISLYLGSQHFDPSAEASLCSVGGNFNCQQVNLSEYGKLSGHISFLPAIPISLVGSAYYIALIALVGLSLSTAEKYRQASYLVIIGGIVSLLLSGYLAAISHFTIKQWCLFCIGMYGFNAVTLASGYWWLQQEKQGDEKASAVLSPINALTGKDDSSLSSMSTAFLIVMILAAWKSGDISSSSDAASGGPGGAWPLEALTKNLVLDGTEPVYGDKNAKYTVVEFADFECPHCKTATPMVKKIIDEFKGDVKLLFKHYPLSNKCNKNMDSAFHENACEAALAADCAHEQGKFWQMNHLIFVNQGYAEFDVFAEQIRLDKDKFATCMKDESKFAGITADIEHGTGVGLSGTPALYFHGINDTTWYKITEREESLRTLLKRLKNGEKP